MDKRCRFVPSGFTIVELLIVLAILALLFQLMLPAIESAREAARRNECSNNLRQLGMAVSSYESVHKVLPRSFVGTPHAHNFVSYLLPYMEQQSVYDAYTFKKDWNDEENRSAVEHDIPILQCPSSSLKYHWISEYAVYRFMSKALYEQLRQENIITVRSNTRGALQRNEIRAARLTDGLSKTVFFCEISGRPDIYQFHTRVRSNKARGSRWADPASRFEISRRCDGSTMDRGTQLINCTNNGEIFSFHPQGVNLVFGDASVRFVLDDVDPNILLSDLTSRAGD